MRFHSFLIRWLPFALGRAYLSLLGRVYYFLNREEKQKIIRNLSGVVRRLFGTVPMNTIIRQTFRGIFAHYYEKLFSSYGGLSRVCHFIRKHVEVTNPHLLDAALCQRI